MERAFATGYQDPARHFREIVMTMVTACTGLALVLGLLIVALVAMFV